MNQQTSTSEPSELSLMLQRTMEWQRLIQQASTDDELTRVMRLIRYELERRAKTNAKIVELRAK